MGLYGGYPGLILADIGKMAIYSSPYVALQILT